MLIEVESEKGNASGCSCISMSEMSKYEPVQGTHLSLRSVCHHREPARGRRCSVCTASAPHRRGCITARAVRHVTQMQVYCLDRKVRNWFLFLFCSVPVSITYYWQLGTNNTLYKGTFPQRRCPISKGFPLGVQESPWKGCTSSPCLFRAWILEVATVPQLERQQFTCQVDCSTECQWCFLGELQGEPHSSTLF